MDSANRSHSQKKRQQSRASQGKNSTSSRRREQEKQTRRPKAGKTEQRNKQPERAARSEITKEKNLVRPLQREPERKGAQQTARPKPFDWSNAPIQNPGDALGGMPQMVLPIETELPPEERAEQEQVEKSRRRMLSRREQIRRRKRGRVFATILLVGFVMAGFLLSVNLLFKVDSYRVENSDKTVPARTGIYSEAAILAVLNVPQGTSLFEINYRQKQLDMEKTMPYLENVRVRFRLPGTLVVQVDPAISRFAVESEGSWAEVSSGLKVLSVGPERPQGLILLQIEQGNAPAVGNSISFADDGDVLAEQINSAEAAGQTEETARLKAIEANHRRTVLVEVMKLLEEEGLTEDVNELDVRDMQEMSFRYQNRITVLLGTANSLPYKLQMAGYILRNENGDCLSKSDRGSLDVSHQQSDGGIEAVFSPENSVDITGSLGQVVTEETAEAESPAGEGAEELDIWKAPEESEPNQ